MTTITIPSKRPGKVPLLDQKDPVTYLKTHTAEEIANDYHVTEATVYRWAKKYATNVVRRPRNHKPKRPDNATLLMLYQHHSSSELAERYDVGPSTIRAWVCDAKKHYDPAIKPEHYQTPVRHQSMAPNDDTLIYLHNNYTAQQIADMYDVTIRVVAEWMRSILSRKMVAPKKPGRKSVRPDIETLAKLYAEHTAAEIADMYHVQTNTVHSWLTQARHKLAQQNAAS